MGPSPRFSFSTSLRVAAPVLMQWRFEGPTEWVRVPMWAVFQVQKVVYEFFVTKVEGVLEGHVWFEKVRRLGKG